LVHLAIVGPDNDGYIQNVVHWCTDFNILDAVTIVDALKKDEVKQAYMDADVFVLPSYTENFGNTVIEALACGCPVVISDQVAIWREIQDSGAGLIVPLDVEKIAIAMQQILENPRLAKEMSDKGKKLIHEKFTWKIIETLFQKHYEEIIVLNNLSRKI
jgi:glycosyltransferase involved in cell wall biosynthesis